MRTADQLDMDPALFDLDRVEVVAGCRMGDFISPRGTRATIPKRDHNFAGPSLLNLRLGVKAPAGDRRPIPHQRLGTGSGDPNCELSNGVDRPTQRRLL